MEACRALVAGLASGEIPSPLMPDTVQMRGLRWAPSFIEGLKSTPDQTVAYRAIDISTMLGNESGRSANAVVLVTLMLLELEEQRQLNAGDLERIYAGGPGLSIVALLRKLRRLWKDGGKARDVIFS